MIKAVLFDVGGTLLGATDLLENIAAGNRGPASNDDIQTQLGSEFFRQIADCRNGSEFKKVVEIIDMSIKTVNRESENCLASVNAAQVYWKTFVTDSFVINDADRAIERLSSQNIELIVASDADAELIYAQIEKHMWSGYFSKYFISSDVKAYKPNDTFVAALNMAICDYEKSDVTMVGDSQVDIETGKKLGVRTALVSGNKQRQYNEDYPIASLLELPEA